MCRRVQCVILVPVQPTYLPTYIQKGESAVELVDEETFIQWRQIVAMLRSTKSLLFSYYVF